MINAAMNLTGSLRISFGIAILLLLPACLIAQTNEAELKVQADKAFRAESYVEASRIYSQLLAFNARDPFYNYRYGVCLIYNSRKKQDAIKHLLYASKEPDHDPEVFYYLGKAYHLNYEFAEAITYYNQYKAEAGGKINLTLQVNRQIEMSENGKRLLSSVDEMVVLEKKEIDNKAFFRIYDLKDIGGQLIVNDQFQSKIDKKKNHSPLIHLPAKPDMIFYSSYGEDEKRGKDIFIRRRLPDGTWSLPQMVNGGVNTLYDEDYPYFHPNGRYLYFCSKGHNSMGGFDVFRATYDKETNTFGEAENLDFPISSPDNDLLYVVDSLDKNAFFASARQSVDDKIHVYKVRVEHVPIQIAVVKAAFSSTVDPSNKKVTVEIYDAANNKIGTFNSTEKGNVIITFPKGGRYEYQITVPGAPDVFKSSVNIPFLKEFKPLKQQLIHEKAEQGETVRIINQFDENIQDAATLAQIAQIRSELNPNADQFDLKQLDQRQANRGIFKELGMEKFSDKEVVDKIGELADKQEKQNENLLKLERKSLDLVVNNAKEIDRLSGELKKVVAAADSKTAGEKRELYEQAGQIVNELNRLDDQAKKLLPTADSLHRVAETNQKNAAATRDLSKQVEKALQEGKMDEVTQVLAEKKNEIKAAQQQNTDYLTDKLTQQIAAVHTDEQKVKDQQKTYIDNKVSAKKEILELEKQLESAKSKDKAAIQKKIDDKNAEVAMVEDELKRLDKKLAALGEEEKSLQNKLAYFQEIQNSKVPESKASRDEASKALSSVDNPNTRSLKAYVEQQNKELGIDMLALKPLDKSKGNGINASEGNGDVAQQKGNNGTQADRGITDEKRGTQGGAGTDQRGIDPQKGSATDKGTGKDPRGATGSNPATSTKAPIVLTPEQQSVISGISPDFAGNMRTIQNDPSLDEEQKLKASQRQEKDMKYLLARELAEAENQLKNNPNDPVAQQNVKQLQEINDALRQQVEQKQEVLAAKYPETNPPRKLTPAQISNQIKPHHQAVLASLAENNELNEAEKREKAQAEDQKMAIALAKARQRIEEELSVDPLNANNKYELDVIKQLQNETDDRINRRSQEMASFGVSDRGANNGIADKGQQNGDPGQQNNGNTTGDKQTGGTGDKSLAGNDQNASGNAGEQLIQELAPNYAKNKEKITYDTKITEKERQKALVAEEDKLQAAVEKRLKAIEQALKKQPEDAALKQEKEQLTAVKERSEARESESKQLIVSEEKKEIKPETLLASVDKSFAKDTAAIKSKGGADVAAKLAERETKLQAAIEKKIADNAKKNAAKEDLHLQAETQLLNELFDASKNRQSGTTATQNPVAGSPLTVEILRSEGLGENKNMLDQESATPEQIKALEGYEQQLVNKLQQNETAQQQTPGDARLQQEKQVLETELELVQRKKRQFSASAGPVENLNGSGTQTPDSLAVKTEGTPDGQPVSQPTESGDPLETMLASLDQKKQELQQKLQDPKVPKKEKLVIANQLNEISLKKTQVIDSVLQVPGSKLASNPPNKIDKNSLTPEGKTQANLALYENQQLKTLQGKMDELKTKIDASKNPVKKAKMIEEYEAMQQEKEKRLNRALYNTNMVTDARKLDESQPVSPLETMDDSTLQVQLDLINSDFKKLKDSVYYWNTKWMKASKGKKEDIDKIRNPLRQQLKYMQEKQIQMTKEQENRLFQQDVMAAPVLVSPAPDTTETRKLHAKANYEPLKKAFYQKQEAREAADSAWQKLELTRRNYQQALNTFADTRKTQDRTALDEAQSALAQAETDWKTKAAAYQKLYQSYAKTTAKEKKTLPRLETLFMAERPVPVKDTVVIAPPDTLSVKVDTVQTEIKPVVAEETKTKKTAGKKKQTKKKTAKKEPKKTPKKEPKQPVEQVPVIEKQVETASHEPSFSEGAKGDFEFKIHPTPKTEPASERIDMSPKVPEGLVFRVQVGAFRRPLKKKMFSEFSPVTGEPISDGITRYISGYFGSLETASKAKGAIRKLGYRDAFVVAYCNGKRITIAEAQRLLASGECVPAPELKSSTPANPELGTTTQPDKTVGGDGNNQQSGVNTGDKPEAKTNEKPATTEKSGSASDYNKAPGAVKAKAVEEYPGLFYTVQIGAYTNPASPKQLKNIENVVSKKLADGKIRYSTGMFHSVQEALPTKQMAIDKGITDAFVTAYYKGERITLVEAERLLKELGSGILENGK